MTDLTKAIELAEKASEQLHKSHVKQYTRSDGTVVKEHDDSRHPNIIGKIAYHNIIGKEGRGEQKGNGDPTHYATTSIGHNGKEYTPTGKTGNSMHDEREVHEFESKDGHRVWADKRGNVHADSKWEADQYHKRGRFAEDDDNRQKKADEARKQANGSSVEALKGKGVIKGSVFRFKNRDAAHNMANNPGAQKPSHVILGDDGHHWVVSPADAQRLEKHGYEYSK